MSFSHLAAPARARRHPAGQRGAALLLAMLVVTLVAALAGGTLWQQWRAVQVESAERSRMQSAWILQGALDWSRLILREDARNGGPDHLGEPWAVPLAEARLSTFLAADRNQTDDAPDTFLSGRIEDAQARFNLRNLVGTSAVSAPDLKALLRLCEIAEIPASVGQTLAEGLQRAVVPRGEGPSPLMPRRLEQLAWLGVDAESVQKLRRFVTLLPARTPINLNTAGPEIVAAVIDNLDLASAQRIVQERQRSPFKDLSAVQRLLPNGTVLDAQRVGVASRFFEVSGRLRLQERTLDERSLVERRGVEVIALWRERVAGLDDGRR
jgi:general secretion pathway protein K